MSTTIAATALVAEDEPLLAAELKKLLKQAWPELRIAAEASDGIAATTQALDATPDILFLDIKMPGRTGLAVAEAVIDEWPDACPTPLIVFITAYDEYALAAFEHQAADYVLKPVTAERIARTVQRLRLRLSERTARRADGDLAKLLAGLQSLAPSFAGTATQRDGLLDAIHVGIGSSVRIVPVDEVLYFEATDKYVGVYSHKEEGLIRMSMRDLIARLDPAVFLQVHRGVVVRRSQIVMATRDEAGRMSLKLRDLPQAIGVSRAFAHHFHAM
ncbi:MAG: LytTR family DNA-binding domain-containing protein [Burkholderiaceae bacterium]